MALNEGLFYRRVMLELLRPLGLRPAVIWSAVGVALAAIRIRTGSLWPVLAVHLVIDWIAVGTLTGPATSSPILLPVLFAWLGANLLLWRYGMGLLPGADITRTGVAATSR